MELFLTFNNEYRHAFEEALDIYLAGQVGV